MNNLQEKILNKINKENLHPTSWQYFLFKKYTIFITLFLSVIFSTLSFSALSFIFTNLDWFYYRDLENNLPFFIFRHFPFFWLILSSLFVTLSVYIWKNSERGYKYSGGVVFCALLFSVIVLGTFLNLFRMGQILDTKLANPVWHPGFQEGRMQIWDQPDKMRIMGEIVEVNQENKIFTVEGRIFLWDIKFADIGAGQENIFVGNKIKMLCRVGEKCELTKFE